MSGRVCACCERPLRKGTARRVYVLAHDGTLKLGNVCARCAIRAVTVVTPPPTTLAPACMCCGREPAAIGRDCFERMGGHVKELAAANVALRSRNGFEARP